MLVRLKNISPGTRVVYDVFGTAHTIPRGKTSREIDVADVTLGRVTVGKQPMFRMISDDEARIEDAAVAAADPATDAETPKEPVQPPALPTTKITAAEVLAMHNQQALATTDLLTYAREILGMSLNGTPRRSHLLELLRTRAEADAVESKRADKAAKRSTNTERANKVAAAKKSAGRVRLRKAG